jgi:hypothetical protein
MARLWVVYSRSAPTSSRAMGFRMTETRFGNFGNGRGVARGRDAPDLASEPDREPLVAAARPPTHDLKMQQRGSTTRRARKFFASIAAACALAAAPGAHAQTMSAAATVAVPAPAAPPAPATPPVPPAPPIATTPPTPPAAPVAATSKTPPKAPLLKPPAGAPASSPPSASTADEEVLPSPSLPPLPAPNDQGQPAAPNSGTPQTAAPEPNDNDPRALEQWRPELDQYGTWTDDPKYGRVWVPDRTVVGDNFSPYVTAGHWALDSDNNWVWVSDYPFGGVVFHYGRWTWGSYGWSWIPGYRYAPAWVEWRVPTGEYDYLGWAPMGPEYIWSGGLAVSLWYPSPYYWVFCPSAYIFAPRPYGYLVTRPGYVRALGGYTRRYVAASPGFATRGPPLGIARVPARAIPAGRISTAQVRGSAFASARVGAGVGIGARSTYATSAFSARTAHTYSTSPSYAYRSQTAFRSPAAPRAVSAPRTVESPRSAYTSYPRTYSQGSSGFRSYSTPTRDYSPAAYRPSSYTPSYHPSSYSPSYRSASTPSYHPSSMPSYRPMSSPSSYHGVSHGSFGGGGGGAHFGGGGGGGHHR